MWITHTRTRGSFIWKGEKYVAYKLSPCPLKRTKISVRNVDKIFVLCAVWGSGSGVAEDAALLGNERVSMCGRIPTLRGNVLSPLKTVSRTHRTLKADSLIAWRSHAAPMPFPCHAVPLRVQNVSFPFDLHSAAVSNSHFPCHAHAMLWPCRSSQGHSTAWPSYWCCQCYGGIFLPIVRLHTDAQGIKICRHNTDNINNRRPCCAVALRRTAWL